MKRNTKKIILAVLVLLTLVIALLSYPGIAILPVEVMFFGLILSQFIGILAWQLLTQ